MQKRLLLFAGGMLAGLIAPAALKSKCARTAAVTITAKSMQLRDDARSAVESLKEEAQDIYAEAKQQRRDDAK